MSDGTEITHSEPRTAPGEVQVRRALLSVSDKTGIVDFARGLAELGGKAGACGRLRKPPEPGLRVRQGIAPGATGGLAG